MSNDPYVVGRSVAAALDPDEPFVVQLVEHHIEMAKQMLALETGLPAEGFTVLIHVEAHVTNPDYLDAGAPMPHCDEHDGGN